MAYASKIANNLLFTPFDNASSVDNIVSEKLTPKEFIKECYVEPDFVLNKEKAIENKNNEEFDFIASYQDYTDQEKEHKRDEENFISWLESETNSKVYTISGNAGTGKTTYINKISMSDKTREWVILDLATVQNRISWIGDNETIIKKFSLSSQKIYSIILEKIKSILFCYTDNRIDILKTSNNIKTLSANYEMKVSQYFQKGKSFFTKLKQIVLNNSDDDFELVQQFSIFINNYFNEVEKNSYNNIVELLCSSLELLLNILRCRADDAFDKKYVIVFDNLERFVAHDELQNNELDIIRKTLYSICAQTYEVGNCHSGFFKFIMVLRNRSVRMCGVKVQSADELPSNLDLSDWYDTNEIIEHKSNWFNLNNIKGITNDINILEQIIGDIRVCEDSAMTGLSLQLNPLFNNNKRLIVDFVGKCIEQPSLYKHLRKYMKYWNLNTEISRCAARSIIRGLLIQELSTMDELFHHLWVYSNDNNNKNNQRLLGLGDSRKLLTILYNYNNNNMPLSTLLSEFYSVRDISKYWHKRVSTVKKKRLAEILLYMSSYNRRQNDWIQFIDLQLYDPYKTIRISTKEELFNIINNQMENITINLMPAGEAYLKYIVASFEYFSYRYGKEDTEYVPLFALVPEPDEISKINDMKDTECYKVINHTKNMALECINAIKKDIPIDLYHNNNNKKHRERIINLHTGYISNLIEFIKMHFMSVIKDSEVINKYQDLITECTKIIGEYNKGREDSVN